MRLRRFTSGASLWLSSVVLEELYAGADSRAQRLLERLERDFERAQRILVPNLSDWSRCGKVLGLLAAKYDYEQIGQGRLTNDVLTANKRDFARIAEIRPFAWELENPLGA